MIKEHLGIIKDKRLLKHALSDFDIKCLIEEVERVKELEQQNKRCREAMKSAVSEIKYALYSNKPKDVKEHYLKNAERDINEALEGDSDE